MAGFAYALSKEAVRNFNQLTNAGKCKFFLNADEDVEIGFCLKNHSKFLDTRDKKHRYKFFVVPPHPALDEFDLDVDYWFFNRQYYDLIQGSDCCSNHPIGFHYVPIEEMYLLRHLFYNVTVFGKN